MKTKVTVLFFGTVEYFEREFLMYAAKSQIRLLSNDQILMVYSRIKDELLFDFVCAETIRKECFENLEVACSRLIKFRNARDQLMRYQIVEIKNKETTVNIRCLDSQEHVLFKVSLKPDTLECTDKFIPESLQSYVDLNKDSIRRYLNKQNPQRRTRKPALDKTLVFV